jgi:6-phosphogluconolactonase
LTEGKAPTGGAGPCYVTVDRAGKNVLVANYGGGSVAVVPIGPEGRLETEHSAFVQHRGSSANPQRQEGPHAHSIVLDAANRFAFAPDLGLDKILVYRFDPAKGTLAPNDPPAAKLAAGAGPRHFDFHPSGRFAYAINELNSTIAAFRYDPERGRLADLQTIGTIPQGASGENDPADVHVHPSGRFLYGSNRGFNSIVAYAIDEDSGRLTLIGQQTEGIKNPRNFAIDPTGKFLLAANQDADTVVIFRIDPDRGTLEPTGHLVKVPKPVCLKFLLRTR